jgi:DivIVA domain-containing protein
MNRESIEEVRSASFTLVRRGYEPDEVRRYLSELADRLQAEGASHPGSDAVRRELELVGEKTAGLLAQAEEGAERMHSEAVREASGILSKARDESEATRSAAAEHAGRVRAEADRYAEETRAEADRESVVEIEAELEGLRAQRDEILEDLSDLVAELERTIAGRAATNGVPAPETSPRPAEPVSMQSGSPEGL